MASIHKLSIRGIRSFSHEREQTIEFYTPLTMIVGANGCGKTTVIECLKYACTGALPPGARNGQAFVHDPKVSGTNEVKAGIKLRFSGRDARMSEVTRLFQLTQRRVTLQFKALDGVIRTKADDGTYLSITHRCTELDKHIPLRLGVSKAILENVVFCHQEDASWPLQEGAVVKKKFDDIFESARYTKALDTIKKTKQEYAITVKDLKIDLAGLQERLRAAETLKSELEASRENYDSIRGEIEAIDARTRELSESLTKLRAVAEQLELLEGQKQSLELTCRDLDVRIGEKRENIGNAMSNESDEALEKDLKEFDEMLDRCADDIKFHKDEADKSSARAQSARRTKGSLQGEQGKLKAQLDHQESYVAERDKMMERLSSKHNIFNPAPSAGMMGGSASSGSKARYRLEDVSSFQAALQRALEEAKKISNDARAKTRREDDAMMAEINKVKLEQRSSADAVRTKERELGKTSGESLSHAQSGGPGGSQSQSGGASEQRLRRQLDAAKKTAETATAAFAKFETENKARTTSTECKVLEKKLGDIKGDMEAQEDVVQVLNSQKKDQDMLALKTAQIVDDVSDLRETVEGSINFNKSLEHTIQDVTVTSMDNAIAEIRAKREETEQDRASAAREVVDIRTEQSQKKITLDNTVRELSQVQHRISVLSGSALQVVREEAETLAKYDPKNGVFDPEAQLDEMLTAFRERIAKKIKFINMQGYRVTITKQMLEIAEREGRCCPTCERSMNDQEYVRFRKIQESHLNEDRTTKKRKDAEGEVEKLKLSVAKLEANSQGWNEWKRVSFRPAKLEAQKEEAIAEKARLDESLEKAEREASDLHRSRKELDLALSEGDMLLVEVYRISKEQGKVDNLKMTLQSYGERESLEEAQKHLKELASKKDKAMTDLQAKNRELQKLTATHLWVTNDKTRAERELDNAATSLRLKQEWDKKKEELKEREKTLQGELRELKAKEQPLRQQMQEKNNTYTRARDQATALVDRVQSAAQECQTEAQAFSRLQRGVAAGEARNLPETLASIQAKLQEVEEAVEQHEQNARESERTMTGKVLQSDKQVHHKKILKDNIEYRGYSRELEERRKEVAVVEAEIAETDSQDVRGKIVELNREVLKRTQKRAELKGRLHGMKDQIRGTEDKLATEAYHHIEEKHRRKMIEHRTTEMAVTDLDKYWTALDKALLRFHTMKITDINKIIRELWAMTYSGEDIDMIEIVSGDDDDVGKAKRSYNYRVVMRKNDATLDMKGRCSAGQRVLASVVIRLALAETFCVSCGILALDEPTTNLDHNNKVGLAHALAKIISSRSRQSNFQLITITHDEEFVQTMRTELGTQGGFSMPEFYWRISRVEMSRGKFYSRIDRLDWEDM